LLLLLPALAAAAPSEPVLEVRWDGSRLTVVAEGVGRFAILRAIASRTRLEVGGLEALVDDPVSIRFAAVPLDEALRRLLGSSDAVIIEEIGPDGEHRPTAVGVFSPGRRHPAVTEAGDPTSDADATGETDQDPRAVLADDAALPPGESRDPETALREILVMTRSDDPLMRRQGLELLDASGEADRGTVLAAFEQVLADGNEALKTYAIDVIAARGSSDSTSILRSALTDPDPQVRMAVVHSIATRDPASPLLHEALSDDDPQVRSLARFSLSRSVDQGGRT